MKKFIFALLFVATAAFAEPSAVARNQTIQIGAGQYTPVVDGSDNVASANPLAFQWMRIGDTVTVSGIIMVQSRAPGLTSFNISLPVPSNLQAIYGGALVGSGYYDQPAGLGAVSVTGNPMYDAFGTGYASVNATALDTHQYEYRVGVHFTYRVIQ